MTRARSRRTARRKIKRQIRKTLNIICAVWDLIARHDSMIELMHDAVIDEMKELIPSFDPEKPTNRQKILICSYVNGWMEDAGHDGRLRGHHESCGSIGRRSCIDI